MKIYLFVIQVHGSWELMDPLEVHRPQVKNSCLVFKRIVGLLLLLFFFSLYSPHTILLAKELLLMSWWSVLSMTSFLASYWWPSSKESACSAGDVGLRCWFKPWMGKMLWRRKWQPIPLFLLGKSHRERSLVDYSPWGRKSRMQLRAKPPPQPMT